MKKRTKSVLILVILKQTIEEKWNGLEEGIESQVAEDAIQTRIQQLSISKVLVNIHKRSVFVMVKASTNLG